MLPEYNEEIIVAQLQDPRRCREAFALVSEALQPIAILADT